MTAKDWRRAGGLALNQIKKLTDRVLAIEPNPESSISLGALADVTITSVLDGQLFAYDSGSGEWVNSTEWSVTATGQLIPSDSTAQGIGDVANPVKRVVLADSAGVMDGGIAITPLGNFEFVSLVGIDEEGLGSLTPTKPVGMRGTGVFLDGNSGYWFAMPDGVQDADVEGRYVVWDSLVDVGGGNLFASIGIGEKVPVSQQDLFTDANDWAGPTTEMAENTTYTVVAGVIPVLYEFVTRFAWECRCENFGDLACTFQIQPRHNGSALGPATFIPMTLDSQLASGSVEFPLPPAATDTVDLQVTAVNFSNPTRPNPFVRGSIDLSTILITQGSTVPAAMGLTTAQALTALDGVDVALQLDEDADSVAMEVTTGTGAGRGEIMTKLPGFFIVQYEFVLDCVQNRTYQIAMQHRTGAVLNSERRETVPLTDNEKFIHMRGYGMFDDIPAGDNWRAVIQEVGGTSAVTIEGATINAIIAGEPKGSGFSAFSSLVVQVISI